MTHTSVLGGQRAIADRHHARIGISHSADGCGVQRDMGSGLHCRVNIADLTYHESPEGSFGDTYPRPSKPSAARQLPAPIATLGLAPKSAHAGRGHRQRRSLARNVDQEAPCLQMVSARLFLRAVFVSAAGIGPQTADFHLA